MIDEEDLVAGRTVLAKCPYDGVTRYGVVEYARGHALFGTAYVRIRFDGVKLHEGVDGAIYYTYALESGHRGWVCQWEKSGACAIHAILTEGKLIT